MGSGASRFRPSPFVEETFARDDVSFKLKTINITDIDVDVSVSSNKRHTHVVADRVEQYAHFMRQGGVFPPLIGYQDQTKKVVLVDGVQRLNAQLSLSDKTTQVYIVDWNTPEDLDLLRYEYASKFNNQNGLPYTSEEREVIIVELHDKGYTNLGIGTIVGLGESRVHKILQEQAAKQRIRETGVTLDGLNQGQILTIARLPNEAEIITLVKHIQRYGMSGDDLRAIVSAVKNKLNQEARSDLLDELLTQDLETRTNPKKIKTKVPHQYMGAATFLATAEQLRKSSNIEEIIKWAKQSTENKIRIKNTIEDLESTIQVLRKRADV